jgi:hypothetical protein
VFIEEGRELDFELKLQCWVGNAGMAECPAHGVRILNFQWGVHALLGKSAGTGIFACRHELREFKGLAGPL